MWASNTNTLWLIAGTVAALTAGTAIRLIAIRNLTADLSRTRINSLKVWWVLVLLWSVAALLGQPGATIFFSLASFLGMREYLRLIGTPSQIGKRAIVSLSVCGTAHYGLIIGEASEIAKWFLPLGLLLALSAARLSKGIRFKAQWLSLPLTDDVGNTQSHSDQLDSETKDFARVTSEIYWGAMLMIYSFSHALFLFEINLKQQPIVGSAGWFLFLVLLTEINDIAQAIVGRKFGRHRITPTVSPNKSLEGLIGGLVMTNVLSLVLAPFMTTMTTGRSFFQGVVLSIIAGTIISLFGFLGDINMSAIKRDAGVKDGSSLLPGMGGMIDRIDSLIFTAPAFYYFAVLIT